MLRILPLLLIAVSTIVVAEDKSGSVCFGKNLAKPASEHTDRLYLRIDDSTKLYFNHPHRGPVLSGLDLDVVHKVEVYFDDQLAQSWIMDFRKLNTKSVLIWRAAGSWRMDTIEASKCR